MDRERERRNREIEEALPLHVEKRLKSVKGGFSDGPL
jgi:hypothetical protein